MGSMTTRAGRRFIVLLVVAVAAAIAGAGVYAAVAGDGVARLCYGKDGAIKVIDDSKSCKGGQESLSVYTKEGADATFVNKADVTPVPAFEEVRETYPDPITPGGSLSMGLRCPTGWTGISGWLFLSDAVTGDPMYGSLPPTRAWREENDGLASAWSFDLRNTYPASIKVTAHVVCLPTPSS